MARKKKEIFTLPTTPEGLIDALLIELEKDEPDDLRVDALRAALLGMGNAYVPALMESIAQCADEQESSDLAVMIHVLGDPRLVQPLQAVALAPDTSVAGRITAVLSLKVYGINLKLDYGHLPPPSPEEAPPSLDEIVDLLVQAQDSEGLEYLVLGLTHAPRELREEMLTRLAQRHGERALPAFAYLAQYPEPEIALSAVKSLGHLQHPLALQILQQVVEQSSHPEVSQAARRSIFRLCETGVEKPSEETDAAWKGERWTIQRALLSLVDGVGSRMMFLQCALPNGGAAWVNVCLNDVVGLKDCLGHECSPEGKEDDSEFIAQVRKAGIVLVDADPHYCHWLIEEGRQKNQQTHFPLPIGYHTWLAPLGAPTVRYAEPLIYNVLDVRKIKDAAALLEESDTLLDERGMESWFFRFDETRPFAEQVLNNARRLGGLPLGVMGIMPEDVLMDAITALFTDETRALLRRRLEEIAYVFHQRNKKKAARQCLVIAQALASDAYSPMDVPFAVQMVANSLTAALGALVGHYAPADINASPWDPVV